MKQDFSGKGNRSRRDQVRRLGFDPDQLTPAEQQELLEREARLALRESPRAASVTTRESGRAPRLTAVL